MWIHRFYADALFAVLRNELVAAVDVIPDWSLRGLGRVLDVCLIRGH